MNSSASVRPLEMAGDIGATAARRRRDGGKTRGLSAELDRAAWCDPSPFRTKDCHAVRNKVIDVRDSWYIALVPIK